MSLQLKRVDILIIGSGLAGVTVALHLPKTYRVLIVSKNRATLSNSDLAQGGIASSYLESSSIDHAHDTLVASKMTARADRVDSLVEEGRTIVEEMERFGVAFDRDKQGRYRVGREGAHGKHRIFHVGGDETGRHVMTALRERLPQNVEVVENVFIDGLTKADGRVVGAIGFNGNERIVIQAGAVVLATGGIGGLVDWTSNCRSVTGDGLVLASNAGAELSNLAHIQFHPTLLAVDSPHLVTEALRGAGAILVDESGRHVMGHHPLGSLAPRDEVASVLTRHEGPVYLDTSRVTEMALRFPKLWATCQAEQIDVTRVPVRPGLHFHMGGVRVDETGSTNVAGLYAVGEAADTGVHGMNRLASNSLLECWVFGKRVAASLRLGEAAYTVTDVTAYELSAEQFQAYRQQIGKWLTISPEFAEMRSFLENTHQLPRTKHVTRQLAERTLQLEAGRILAHALMRTEESNEQNFTARAAQAIFN